MSFLYPRSVSISRPAAQTGVGFQTGYLADTKDAETPVPNCSNLPASIQARATAGRSPVGLPADGKVANWRVFIPKRASPPAGTIINRDIVTDDVGNRFQVLADYWNSLGYNLLCERLEA